MGATKAELASRYGITEKAVERRVHRLRVAALLPPAPGHPRPMEADALAREQREAWRRDRARRRQEKAEARLAAHARRAVEAVEAEARAEALAERERERARADAVADAASRRRREEELEAHRLRALEEGPVLDLFLD